MTIFASMLLASTLTTLGWTRIIPAQVRAPATDEDQAAVELVDLLWTSENAQRLSAKRKLLSLGPAAIPPLLALLQDICRYPHKERFPKGREVKARRAFNHYQDYEPEKLYDLEITGRLRDDAAELLGQLHAVEAMPILIELMRRQVETSFPRGLNRIMRSLAQIGSPAVPRLIEEIENAPSNASSLVLRDEGPASESVDKLRPTNKSNQWDGLREVAVIRIRAVLVLGEIGDERALPALERFLHSNSEPMPLEIESPYVTHAIDRIREKLRSRQ